MQVLLCGAEGGRPGLGFQASARVLARLNAVSRRLFPLPPALAAAQDRTGPQTADENVDGAEVTAAGGATGATGAAASSCKLRDHVIQGRLLMGLRWTGGAMEVDASQCPADLDVGERLSSAVPLLCSCRVLNPAQLAPKAAVMLDGSRWPSEQACLASVPMRCRLSSSHCAACTGAPAGCSEVHRHLSLFPEVAPSEIWIVLAASMLQAEQLAVGRR